VQVDSLQGVIHPDGTEEEAGGVRSALDKVLGLAGSLGCGLIVRKDSGIIQTPMRTKWEEAGATDD